MNTLREIATGAFWGFSGTVAVYIFFRTAAAGWSAGRKGQRTDVNLNINGGQDILVVPGRKGGVDE